MMHSCIQANKNVAIDRCNISKHQRSIWVNIAREFGIETIDCVYFNIDPETCRERVLSRDNHESKKSKEDVVKAISQMEEIHIPPQKEEGLNVYTVFPTLTPEEIRDKILENIIGDKQ